jgi:hypothetical protein
MYCSQCGAKATGKFCSQCGAKLVPADLRHEAVDSEMRDGKADLQGDWSQVTDYEQLLRYSQVRERIAHAASQSTARLTGEEFLKLCEKALAPLTQTPIPFTAIAKIGQPLNASLGIKTGKQRSESFQLPPGLVLVSVLCSLARHGMKLKHARQIDDGCVLEAEMGSDMFALAGNLTVTVRRQAGGTLVEAATHIPGQLFDWGKSARCLEQIIHEARSAA